MKKILTLVLCFFAASLAQSIPCSEVFIVRPTISPDIIPGSFEPGELASAGSVIADAIQARVKASSETISEAEADSVRGCTCKVVVVRVKSYQRKSADIGRGRGMITVKIDIYPSWTDKTPISSQLLTATGYKAWGDSQPLSNAATAIGKKIKNELLINL